MDCVFFFGEVLGDAFFFGEGLGDAFFFGEILGDAVFFGEALGDAVFFGEALGDTCFFGVDFGEAFGEVLGEAPFFGDCPLFCDALGVLGEAGFLGEAFCSSNGLSSGEALFFGVGDACFFGEAFGDFFGGGEAGAGGASVEEAGAVPRAASSLASSSICWNILSHASSSWRLASSSEVFIRKRFFLIEARSGGSCGSGPGCGRAAACTGCSFTSFAHGFVSSSLPDPMEASMKPAMADGGTQDRAIAL